MASWEPVDIDCYKISDEEYEWSDELTNNLEIRFNKLGQFNRTMYGSHDDDLIDITAKNKDALKHDTIELIANQIYDKLTILVNDTRKRLGIQKGIPIDPIRKYNNFDLKDDGELSYVSKKTVIDLGNINERLKSPWEICKLGVSKLRSMGFTNITDEDINPYRPKYKSKREAYKIRWCLKRKIKTDSVSIYN